MVGSHILCNGYVRFTYVVQWVYKVLRTQGPYVSYDGYVRLLCVLYDGYISFLYVV